MSSLSTTGQQAGSYAPVRGECAADLRVEFGRRGLFTPALRAEYPAVRDVPMDVVRESIYEARAEEAKRKAAAEAEAARLLAEEQALAEAAEAAAKLAAAVIVTPPAPPTAEAKPRMVLVSPVFPPTSRPDVRRPQAPAPRPAHASDPKGDELVVPPYYAQNARTEKVLRGWAKPRRQALIQGWGTTAVPLEEVIRLLEERQAAAAKAKADEAAAETESRKTGRGMFVPPYIVEEAVTFDDLMRVAKTPAELQRTNWKAVAVPFEDANARRLERVGGLPSQTARRLTAAAPPAPKPAPAPAAPQAPKPAAEAAAPAPRKERETRIMGLQGLEAALARAREVTPGLGSVKPSGSEPKGKTKKGGKR